MKAFAKNLVKIGFVGALLYFLAQRGFLSAQATARAFTQLQYMIPAYLLLFLNLPLGMSRWRWLLKAQGTDLSFQKIAQLSLIGNFFNLALPGAVSGDFVKAFYVAKEVGASSKGRTFGSILFDRLIGLSGLVLVSAFALILESSRGTSSGESARLLQALTFIVSLAAAAVVFFFGYLFLVKERHDPFLRFLKWAESKISKLGSLRRIYEGTRFYHHHRWIVTKAMLASITIHLICGFSCVLLSKALGDDLSFLSILVVVPLGLLATAVPIMPAGIGTGHAAFGFLFILLGSQRGADVFTLFVLNQLISGAIGGIVYLRFKGTAPAPDFGTV